MPPDTPDDILFELERLNPRQLQRLNLLLLLILEHPASLGDTVANNRHDGVLQIFRQFLEVLPNDACSG